MQSKGELHQDRRTLPSPGWSGVGISFSMSCAFGTRSGSVRQPSEDMSMNVYNAWQDVFVYRVTVHCVGCTAAEAWLCACSVASLCRVASFCGNARTVQLCSVSHHLLPTPPAKPTLWLREPVLGVCGADVLSEQRLLIRRRHPLFQGAQLRIGHLRAPKMCVERCAQHVTPATSGDAGQLHGAAADAFVNRSECAITLVAHQPGMCGCLFPFRCQPRPVHRLGESGHAPSVQAALVAVHTSQATGRHYLANRSTWMRLISTWSSSATS